MSFYIKKGLNGKFCFCLIKPNSSTVKSFKHVPLVWHTFSDVKPTHFLLINWKSFGVKISSFYNFLDMYF